MYRVTYMILLLLLCIAACSKPAPEATQRSTLASTPPPIVLPDLSPMEPSVQKQIRDAQAAVTKATESRAAPADLANAYGDLGNLLLAAEYANAAEPCYLNAQALAPNDMRWPYFLGHIYRTRGETGKAAASFERVLMLAPSDVATLVWLGQMYLDQGKPADAASLFGRAASLQPKAVAAIAGQGRAALANHDYSHAVEYFEQALKLDPRASMVHYPLALAYRGLGEMGQAEAHARQSGDLEVGPPDPLMQSLTGLLQSAVSYEKQGIRALDSHNWPQAVTLFRKAIELSPKNASLHHRLGTALSLTGEFKSAAVEFQETLRLSPSDAPAHFSLGVLQASDSRFPEALEHFSAAVKSDPQYAEARLQLANVLIRLKRYQEAYDQLTEGARRNPERGEFAAAIRQFNVQRRER